MSHFFFTFWEKTDRWTDDSRLTSSVKVSVKVCRSSLNELDLIYPAAFAAIRKKNTHSRNVCSILYVQWMKQVQIKCNWWYWRSETWEDSIGREFHVHLSSNGVRLLLWCHSVTFLQIICFIKDNVTMTTHCGCSLWWHQRCYRKSRWTGSGN